MKHVSYFLVFFFWCAVSSLQAQKLSNADTLKTPEKTNYRSPKTASILSAVLPGAGQVYNKKYWKVPIVYGAMGTAVYFIDYNTKKRNIFRDELIARLDTNSSTVPDPELAKHSQAQIEDAKNYYKRMLDISYASLVAIYLLNIIDASVDAHLFTFDVSKDLSLRWQPYREINFQQQTFTGLKVSLTF